MPTRQHPYRCAEPPRRARVEAAPPDLGLRIVGGVVLGLSLLRIAVCTVRGLDVEGVIAVVIVGVSAACHER